MTGADDAWRGHWLRIVLLALVFSALWLAISLFSSTSSASADEAKPGSLLATVGSVVGGVTETTNRSATPSVRSSTRWSSRSTRPSNPCSSR